MKKRAKKAKESQNKGGRPSKLTPEVQERIVAVIRANGYVETAASFAGIDQDTYHEWLKRGAREEKGIYKEFSEAINKALAEGEVRGIANIQRAANGYDVVRTRTTTEQKPVKDDAGKMGMATVTTTTEEKSREFAWQAQAWLLERRFPNHWARRDFVEMGGDIAKPLRIQAEVDIYDPLRMAKLIAAFADVQLISPTVIELIEGKDFIGGNGPDPD